MHAIKNIPDSVWQRFKMESAKQGLTMGEFFEQLLQEHVRRKQEGKRVWSAIFEGKALLSEKEAKVLKEEAESFREGFAFR